MLKIKMKMKMKSNFKILLTGCILIMLLMIYGCSTAQEEVKIVDMAEEEIKAAEEGQSWAGTGEVPPAVIEPIEEKEIIEAQEYQDGVYTGVSKKVEGRGYAEVTIEIVDNNITKASIVEYHGDNSAKDPDIYTIPVPDGEDILLREVFVTLESKIVEMDTYDVDIITGATESCYKVIQATYSALQKAQEIEKEKDIEEILELELCNV